MGKPLEIWTVYNSPKDHPGRFVARKWLLDRSTNELLQDMTLEGLRQQLPQGLVRLERSPRDEPQIVEIWV